MKRSTNTLWHHASVTRARRQQLNDHRSVAIWFTGLSGSGKSTLSHAVEESLYRMACRNFVLDGDNVRVSMTLDQSVGHVINFLRSRGIIPAAQ